MDALKFWLIIVWDSKNRIIPTEQQQKKNTTNAKTEMRTKGNKLWMSARARAHCRYYWYFRSVLKMFKLHFRVLSSDDTTFQRQDEHFVFVVFARKDTLFFPHFPVGCDFFSRGYFWFPFFPSIFSNIFITYTHRTINTSIICNIFLPWIDDDDDDNGGGGGDGDDDDEM